ncbi:antA/AntB antirepressor family protein [Ornithobacterium rhinotracheale]|uniref:antA/AntB antirepressor family protein n=1 Tax=Ornithobacterium rhinotracheale TaxID=28251 RepID=UPI001FF1F9A8|nr:antA/AntB antirepressor family protein [Ornithobacterium rhinotracheale]MCK0203528.1 antA/AntB antirepressor family protein [Ornithobacterium rhinotracheale]
MTELITITEQNGENTVSAKELHQFLGSNEQFGKWIKRMLSYGYTQGVDYEHLALLVPTANGGHIEAKDYVLTLDTAKEIAMLQRSKKGREIRRYFIEVEKTARKQFIQMPKSINVFGMEALPYDWWLLQNGYSVSSGQRNARIRKHPEHFYKGTNGWYINKLYAEALLAIKLGKEKLQQVQALPQLNQLEMF